MTTHRDMMCITCPLGCRMELDIEDGKITAVRHNACKRGMDYAHQEFYDPRRMVTTTATVTAGALKRVPVRTSRPLPVKQINALLTAIHVLRLAAPLDMGKPIITNFANTGVDVITTRNLQKANGSVGTFGDNEG
jgi:CxxC motif-containing protein